MSSEHVYQYPPFEVSRRVWSDPTCMLLVFIGSSAEFPLNPSVEWLFYTGRLPSDPLSRFLETVAWLRRLIVADEETRNRDARKLKQMHEVLEQKRGDTIPGSSYRDVLCMNMVYSIRGAALVTGKRLKHDRVADGDRGSAVDMAAAMRSAGRANGAVGPQPVHVEIARFVSSCAGALELQAAHFRIPLTDRRRASGTVGDRKAAFVETDAMVDAAAVSHRPVSMGLPNPAAKEDQANGSQLGEINAILKLG